MRENENLTSISHTEVPGVRNLQVRVCEEGQETCIFNRNWNFDRQRSVKSNKCMVNVDLNYFSTCFPFQLYDKKHSGYSIRDGLLIAVPMVLKI